MLSIEVRYPEGPEIFKYDSELLSWQNNSLRGADDLREINVLAESWQRSGSYFPLGLRAGLPDIVPWFESTGFPIKISDPSVEETREEGEED